MGEHYVHSYIRSDGTFVSGHYRTNRDNSFWNNYSRTATSTRTPVAPDISCRELAAPLTAYGCTDRSFNRVSVRAHHYLIEVIVKLPRW